MYSRKRTGVLPSGRRHPPGRRRDTGSCSGRRTSPYHTRRSADRTGHRTPTAAGPSPGPARPPELPTLRRSPCPPPAPAASPGWMHRRHRCGGYWKRTGNPAVPSRDVPARGMPRLRYCLRQTGSRACTSPPPNSSQYSAGVLIPLWETLPSGPGHKSSSVVQLTGFSVPCCSNSLVIMMASSRGCS